MPLIDINLDPTGITVTTPIVTVSVGDTTTAAPAPSPSPAPAPAPAAPVEDWMTKLFMEQYLIALTYQAKGS